MGMSRRLSSYDLNQPEGLVVYSDDSKSMYPNVKVLLAVDYSNQWIFPVHADS